MEEAMGPRLRQDPTELVPEIREVTGALMKATMNGSVPATTIGLIYLRAGHIVGNTYQVMRHSVSLRKAGESEERIASVASWWDAPYYSDAERAALALTDAVFAPNVRGRERVPDDLFAEISAHYDERALATLTAVLGSAGYWMNVALILKPAPLGQEVRTA
jgi:alkylhydroperoxidase family enzyme